MGILAPSYGGNHVSMGIPQGGTPAVMFVGNPHEYYRYNLHKP